MNDQELFSHLTGDSENDRYQLKADVRELQQALDEANAKISSLETDVDSYRRLARCNQEEADALRRAAGVACDDTIGEGIAKVRELAKKSK